LAGPPVIGFDDKDTHVNEIARRLRAQIPSSTDPDRLERMAREAEGRRTVLAGTRPGTDVEAEHAAASAQNYRRQHRVP
jgi:hypothetical protein